MTKHKTNKPRTEKHLSPEEELAAHVVNAKFEETSPTSLGSPATPSPLEKPRSPKFMSRLMEHNPLHRQCSSTGSPQEEEEEHVKYRSMDIAKKLRRKVVAPSVNLRDDGSADPKEKKNKLKLRKFITSVYHERVVEKSSLRASAGPGKGPVFGVPLVTAVQRSHVSENLPLCRVFQDSVMFIETFGLQREGIYRVPGFRAKCNDLKLCYNKGDPVKLTDYDPETVGMLLKLYLRELPEPLLTRQLGAQFEGVLQYEDAERRTRELRAMLRQLPPEHYATLAWLCLHMNHVSQHEKQNKMTLTNLIIILSPTLLISNTLLRCLCENPQLLFPGVYLDPNAGIPTEAEVEAMCVTTPSVEVTAPAALQPSPAPSSPAATSQPDNSMEISKEELVQSCVWVQARNDALRFVKQQLTAQLREESNIVNGYQEQIREFEEQTSYSIDTVVLRSGRPRNNSSRRAPSRQSSGTSERPSDEEEPPRQEQTQETEEDMKMYLSTLEQMNSELESDKTSLYNSIISDTFACIDAYTEIRFRQTFQQKSET